jgi:hypothetical protein
MIDKIYIEKEAKAKIVGGGEEGRTIPFKKEIVRIRKDWAPPLFYPSWDCAL